MERVKGIIPLIANSGEAREVTFHFQEFRNCNGFVLAGHLTAQRARRITGPLVLL